MSSEDLEKYETEMELQLYKEYRDVVGLFTHVVETERRFYFANSVDVKVRTDGGEVFFDVTMADAWVWDIYRPARFVNVRSARDAYAARTVQVTAPPGMVDDVAMSVAPSSDVLCPAPGELS